ncbi:MAG: hypothetical protein ACI3XQ_07190 [Eubacteriales bacterium]
MKEALPRAPLSRTSGRKDITDQKLLKEVRGKLFTEKLPPKDIKFKT